MIPIQAVNRIQYAMIMPIRECAGKGNNAQKYTKKVLKLMRYPRKTSHY
jgi:hypothetical protein